MGGTTGRDGGQDTHGVQLKAPDLLEWGRHPGPDGGVGCEDGDRSGSHAPCPPRCGSLIACPAGRRPLRRGSIEACIRFLELRLPAAEPVGARNGVVTGQAAYLYSLMRPSQRVVRTSRRGSVPRRLVSRSVAGSRGRGVGVPVFAHRYGPERGHLSLRSVVWTRRRPPRQGRQCVSRDGDCPGRDLYGAPRGPVGRPSGWT